MNDPMPVRAFRDGENYSWDDVPLKEYKTEGTHFRDITRQVLFSDEHGLPSELRYFEVAPGGHSTLERHQHIHAVMILRGRGRVLVGSKIYPIAAFDLVHVQPLTWHQFRADDDSPLGFLCLVACDRDRPLRPTPEDADLLRQDPAVADFIRL